MRREARHSGWADVSLDVRARARGLFARARALVYRVLDTVPPVRRTVDDLMRVEVLDRSMVIAAQGLLALVPLLVVLVAYLPSELTTAGVEQFESATGIDQTGTATPDSGSVGHSTGVVGLAITVFSAASFARAIQRMYERVWVGTIGLVLALAAWLVGFGAVLVVAAVVGRVLGDDPFLRALLRRERSRLPALPGRAGHRVVGVVTDGDGVARQELEHQQHEQRADDES